MQFKTLFTASLLSAVAVAAPEGTKTGPPRTEDSPVPKAFGLVALRSGSPIHYKHFSASESGFDLGLPKDKQNATCWSKSDGAAIFRLTEGELFLYNTGKEQQRAYTDRSGMGQGVLQYGHQKDLPATFETEGWKIDKAGNLNFDNAKGFMACPGDPKGPWSVWVATGNPRPGNSDKDCYSFNARVVEVKHPVSCVYTEYSA
ncbi:hypothetical protein IL306_011613 [Fusarium sp. DS 682]|nr:hypothetical protein IL306_011613 [Fusarium sp. DS 682]